MGLFVALLAIETIFTIEAVEKCLDARRSENFGCRRTLPYVKAGIFDGTTQIGAYQRSQTYLAKTWLPILFIIGLDQIHLLVAFAGFQ